MHSTTVSVRRRLARIAPLRAVYHLITQPRRTIDEAIRRVRKDGVFNSERELYMASLEPRPLWDVLIARFAPESLLDVGCGVGRTIDYFVDRGVEAFGIEASALAIRHARHPERIECRDLRRGAYRHPKAPFDIVWCYEVAEHLHEDFSDALVETLVSSGRTVVLSAAQPGQGGVGHLNERPVSYWRTKVEARGFVLDAETTSIVQSLPIEYAANLQVFRESAP